MNIEWWHWLVGGIVPTAQVGEMELDAALSSRDKITARLRESIADEAVDWGLTVKSVEIQDIKPSPSMQRAMELQASAEAIRRVAAAVGDQAGPMMYLLGAKYTASMERMGSSDSAKVAI